MNTSTNGLRKRPRILIAGAGIGGLTAALTLLKKGFDCDVYEQSPVLRELGAGLWISPNGQRVLFDLGLEEEMRDVNLSATDRVVRLWDSGKSVSVYNRGASTGVDHTLFMLLRAEMQRILAENVRRIKPDAIHLNAKCVGFEQDAEKVLLKFDDGSSVSGDALIGADGLHSKIRQAAFGPAPGKFTGAVAWRGLVPMDRLPAHHNQPIASTWVGPTAHVTSYPVRSGDGHMMSFSGQAESSAWQEESWSQHGSISECLQDFAGWHEDIVALIENAETLYKWGLFVREPLKAWSVGRVSLLGDACHSMVPYLGQGVNMAIEDAGVLARCIEKQPDDPAAALALYQKARVERTTNAVHRSSDMQYTFHNAALANPDTAVGYIQKQWHPEQVRARYDWLFSYDPTRVPL
jgi:salicylate hydroxylase